jgi:hypothetical protein
VHFFPQFVDAIRDKLNKPQYGKLLFDNICIVGYIDYKIDETSTLGTGPFYDKELAPR